MSRPTITQNQVASLASALSGKASTGAVASSGLTMATARLLGRTTASTGAVEEITVGTGLTLTGGTLSASASGGTKTIRTWNGADAVPSGNPPTEYAGINYIKSWQFADSDTQSLYFQGHFPEGISFASGLQVRLSWASTAVSGDVYWFVSFKRLVNLSSTINIQSASSDTYFAGTADDTSMSGNITTISVTSDKFNGFSAGEPFLMTVGRFGSSGSDTVASNAYLFAVELRAP